MKRMNPMPQKPASLILVTYLGMLLLAPALGAGAGYLLDSQVPGCMTLGAIAMLLGYFASLLSWYGAKSLRVLPALSRLASGKKDSAPQRALEDLPDESSPLAGSILFIPICGLICAGFGLVIAYSSRALFVNSFFTLATLGAAYGWVLHRCAAGGWLIAPEQLD